MVRTRLVTIDSRGNEDVTEWQIVPDRETAEATNAISEAALKDIYELLRALGGDYRFEYEDVEEDESGRDGQPGREK